jgi:hypothetical protein
VFGLPYNCYGVGVLLNTLPEIRSIATDLPTDYFCQ